MKLILLLQYLIMQNVFFVNSMRNDTVMRMELNFVSDYFAKREIRVGVIFACTLQESVDMLRVLMHDRTVLSKYYNFSTDKLFKFMMTSPYDKLGVYLNYTCDFGKYVFSMSSESNLFTERYVWLVINDNEDEINEFKKFNLQLDTDMIAAVFKKGSDYNSTENNITDLYVNDYENNDKILLHDLYKIQHNSEVIVTFAGYWNESQLNITLEGTKISRRSDFRGITINGTGVLTELIINETEEFLSKIVDVTYEGHLDILHRFALVMNMNLGQLYNFTINVTFANDWGQKSPNGLYDGMIGEVQSGRAEIGLSTVIMNDSLLDIVDFSFPIWKFRPLFILRNPRTFGTYDALLFPFTIDAWIFIILLKIFIIILLTIFRNINAAKCNKNRSTVADLTWSENCVIIVGAFAAQGLAGCSTILSERILLYVSLVVGMLICAFYNSMVVTALLMPPPPSIQTCEHLLESNLGVVVTNITYYIRYFQISNDELTNNIFIKKLSNNKAFMGPEEGMDYVKRKRFAFYGEEATIYPLIADTFTNSEICKLVEIELISPIYLPCPYKKHSPLKQFINSGFHLMRERGIVMRERKQWHKERPACQGTTEVSSIQLQTLVIAYVILLVGIFLSLTIFIIELLIHKVNIYHKPKQKGRIILTPKDYKY